MPRDTAGNYTLPAGNPVASGEIISASWANSTMNDLGQSLSASLDRYGRGGMLAPFQFTDGTESAPGATWSNEPTTGLYRAAYGDLRFTLTGTDVQRWTSANAYLWRNSQWEEILTQTGGGGDTTINNLVVTGSFTSPGIDDNATSTAITIDADENVGIGTNAPNIMGWGNALTINSGTQPAIELAQAGVATGYFASQSDGRLRLGNQVSGQPIQFLTADAGVAAVIDGAGNVGIGTNAPFSFSSAQATLTLSGTSVDPARGGCLAFTSPDGTSTRTLIQSRDGFMSFYTGSAATSTERLRIDAAGTTTVTGGFMAAQPGAAGDAFAAGFGAGAFSQGDSAIAIGRDSGNSAQGADGIAIGKNAGQASQGAYGIAIGRDSGITSQEQNAVAIGVNAGKGFQGNSSVAIGNGSGFSNQADYSVALGVLAAETDQGEGGVAIGNLAGRTSQSSNSIAIGSSAGVGSQGGASIAIGQAAGTSGQLTQAIAIGKDAGTLNQQHNSIAIGTKAGELNQGANGIILNSSGSAQNMPQANHIFITSGSQKYLEYNGADTWTFAGGDVKVPNDSLLVGRSDVNFGGGSIGSILPSSGRGLFENTGDATLAINRKDGTTYANIIQFYRGNSLAGTIQAQSGAAPQFAANSDRRLKDNIIDHESELANVMALRPVRWDWKEEGLGQGEGFIAQEVQETSWSDLVLEGDDGMLQLGGLGTVETRLIKAIQEQQAMIETLQAEVAALKGA